MFNVSSKLLLNWASSSLLKAYFYTFLHELPPPLHGLKWWCSPTVTLLLRFVTQNRNLTLAVCSSRPGF